MHRWIYRILFCRYWFWLSNFFEFWGLKDLKDARYANFLEVCPTHDCIVKRKFTIESQWAYHLKPAKCEKTWKCNICGGDFSLCNTCENFTLLKVLTVLVPKALDYSTFCIDTRVNIFVRRDGRENFAHSTVVILFLVLASKNLFEYVNICEENLRFRFMFARNRNRKKWKYKTKSKFKENEIGIL